MITAEAQAQMFYRMLEPDAAPPWERAASEVRARYMEMGRQSAEMLAKMAGSREWPRDVPVLGTRPLR